VSHPIQYQAPLLSLLAHESDIDLKVFFCSDISVHEFVDEGFGQKVKWDVPLLEGYDYEFLPALGGTKRVDFWRPFNYGLLKRLKEYKPDVLIIHGYMRWFNWQAIAIAKLLGIRVFVRDESTLFTKYRGRLKLFGKRIFFSVLKLAVNGWLVIGTSNKEYYLYYGVRENNLFLVPYTVNNDYFQKKIESVAGSRDNLKQELGLEKERSIILFASKFQSRKRAQDLIEAYCRLSPDGKQEPEPYLLFIGDGEERANLEKQAFETGWDSIKFLGFKNQLELPQFYDLCSVFVLPSMHEPWGLVVNEAMNAGRAIIVSDQVGCGKDLVKQGKNGYIFKAGSVTELHQALIDVLVDINVAESMGKESLNIINQWSYKQDIIGIRDGIGLN